MQPVGRGFEPRRVIPKTLKKYSLPSRMALDIRESNGKVKPAELPGSQPPAIAFTAFADVWPSLHSMVYCIRKQTGSVTRGHKMIKARKMKNFIEGEFLADVASVCCDQVVTMTDNINSLVNDWSAIFSALIEKHAPLTEMRVSEKYCPWIDLDLKNLMRTRDRLKATAIKRKSPIIMDSYRKIRNKINLLNKLLKSSITLTIFPAIRET